MRKIIYKLTAYLLQKQFDTGRHTTGSHYNEWCIHCRATEAVSFLHDITETEKERLERIRQAATVATDKQ